MTAVCEDQSDAESFLLCPAVFGLAHLLDLTGIISFVLSKYGTLGADFIIIFNQGVCRSGRCRLLQEIDLQHKPKHVYSGVNHTIFHGAYSQGKCE